MGSRLTDFSVKDKVSVFFLRLFGFSENEDPRLVLDIFLSAASGFSTVFLLAYSLEKHPSERARHSAIAAISILVLAFVLARYRVPVVIGVVGIVGFRSLIAFSLYGQIWGLPAALAALAIVILGIRWFPINTQRR